MANELPTVTVNTKSFIILSDYLANEVAAIQNRIASAEWFADHLNNCNVASETLHEHVAMISMYENALETMLECACKYGYAAQK